MSKVNDDQRVDALSPEPPIRRWENEGGAVSDDDTTDADDAD